MASRKCRDWCNNQQVLAMLVYFCKASGCMVNMLSLFSDLNRMERIFSCLSPFLRSWNVFWNVLLEKRRTRRKKVLPIVFKRAAEQNVYIYIELSRESIRLKCITLTGSHRRQPLVVQFGAFINVWSSFFCRWLGGGWAVAPTLGKLVHWHDAASIIILILAAKQRTTDEV